MNYGRTKTNDQWTRTLPEAIQLIKDLNIPTEAEEALISGELRKIRKLLGISAIQDWHAFFPELIQPHILVLNTLLYINMDRVCDPITEKASFDNRAEMDELSLYQFLFSSSHPFWKRFFNRQTARSIWQARLRELNSLNSASYVKAISSYKYYFFSVVDATYYCGISDEPKHFFNILTSLQYRVAAHYMMTDLKRLETGSNPISELTCLRLVQIQKEMGIDTYLDIPAVLRTECQKLLKIALECISQISIPDFQKDIIEAIRRLRR